MNDLIAFCRYVLFSVGIRLFRVKWNKFVGTKVGLVLGETNFKFKLFKLGLTEMTSFKAE